MEQESDEAILQRVARGDEAAFAALYDRFAAPLYTIAKRILDDEQDVRDALQDGFIYLWEKAPEYDPNRSKAFSWAVTIFRHKAIDRLRASRRRYRLTEDATKNLLDLDKPASEGADHALDRAERADMVRRAMKSLPEEQRRCVEWAFLKGLTHHQLSDLFGAPLGTVKTNIRRGLLRLRDILKGGES